MSRQQFVRVCSCGCGQPTLLAVKSSTRNSWTKGQPLPILHGHGGRRRAPDFIVNEQTGCWEWQGWRDRQGYGGTWLNGRSARAHRVVYEQHRGPIPVGLTLDHLCRVTRCVNPDHLEPVTVLENIRRSPSAVGRALRTGRCIRDHEFNDENTHISSTGQRVCRACGRTRYHEKKAAS